jgi:CheY-like chemotaxis protein
MSPVAERTETEVLPEAVLIVEDDQHASRRLEKALEKMDDQIPVWTARTIADAWDKLEDPLVNNVENLVIVLDLMLETDLPSEGCAFLDELQKHPGFREEKINVIVLTAASDPATRNEVLEAGAKRVHAKPDLRPVLGDIPVFLGRLVKTTQSLVEVVDVNPLEREVEVRYQIPGGRDPVSEERWIHCTLGYDDVPAPARVPGGSFYLDIYKQFKRGRMKTEAISRPVDTDEDRKRLSELLD